MKAFVYAVGLTCIASILHSQTDEDPCAAVLRIGLHDSMKTAYQRDSRDAVYDFLCSEDSNHSLISIGSGGSIPIPQLGNLASGHFDAAKVDDWRKASCSTRSEQFSEQVATAFLSNVLSQYAPQAIAAWRDCRQASSASASPAVPVITDYDGDNFTLTIRYRPVGNVPVKIKRFAQTNVNCEWAPKKNSIFDLDQTFQCSRGSGRGRMAIDLSFSNAQPMRAVVFPRRSPAIKTCGEHDHCSGTVIACQHVGDDDDGVTHLNYDVAGRWVVTYGHWSNHECGTEGEGWHQAAGTCGKGYGNGYKRCGSVRVIPDQAQP